MTEDKRMTTIHIKATQDVDDKIISELMNILIKYNFKVEKYLGIATKIVMAKLQDDTQNEKENK